MATLLAMLVLFVSCAPTQPAVTAGAGEKIAIDLAQLDSDGLRGTAAGKAAVAYEFSIPNTDECRAQAAVIDEAIHFMPGSRGRIGTGPQECLGVGSTHRQDFRRVLNALAELPFVRRIVECQYEQ